MTNAFMIKSLTHAVSRSAAWELVAVMRVVHYLNANYFNAKNGTRIGNANPIT
jgi:hypothetical protein